MKRFFALICVLMITGCGLKPSLEDEKLSDLQLNLEEFFDGEAQARILGKRDSATSRRPASSGSKKRVKFRENDQGKLL